MKKLISAAAIILLFGTFSSALAQTQMATGKFSANSSSQGYTLDKNSGERSHTIEIAFPKPFDIKPTVVVAVTMLDADKASNVRYSVEPVSISRDGFTVKISTWGDTKILGIGGSWVAHSE